MFKLRFLRLSCLLLAALFLAGCNRTDPVEQNQDTQAPATTQATQATQSTPAVALEVLSWDADRCMVTSGCQMAETEQGYYYIHNMLLYYADKSDLSDWVVVCTDPACNHETLGENICEAMVDEGFQLHDGRLYYSVSAERYPELSATGANGRILISTALDGTDRRLAYAPMEEATALPDSQKTIMLPDRWLVLNGYLNADGTATGRVLSLHGEELQELYQVTRSDLNAVSTAAITARTMWELYGDSAIWGGMLSETAMMQYYRVSDEGITVLMETGQYPTTGAYLSGDRLYFFRPNEGYFVADLVAGEETKLAEPRMGSSFAYQLLSDCILESTLLGNTSTTLRAGIEEHTMELCDGENWFVVSVPDELQELSDAAFLVPLAVTSDRILLRVHEPAVGMNAPQGLYQILLGTDSLELAYVGTIG